jgi:hypothetical protein
VISIQPLTLYEFFSVIDYFIIFVTVVVSVYLIMHQTREMSSQTQCLIDSLASNVYQNVTLQIFALDEIFIDHPELRPYFYSGKDISEGNPDYQRALATAEFILDLFGTSFDLMPQYPKNWSSGDAWKAYIQQTFASSPILCWYLDEHIDWYHTEMVDLRQAATRK